MCSLRDGLYVSRHNAPRCGCLFGWLAYLLAGWPVGWLAVGFAFSLKPLGVCCLLCLIVCTNTSLPWLPRVVERVRHNPLHYCGPMFPPFLAYGWFVGSIWALLIYLPSSTVVHLDLYYRMPKVPFVGRRQCDPNQLPGNFHKCV